MRFPIVLFACLFAGGFSQIQGAEPPQPSAQATAVSSTLSTAAAKSATSNDTKATEAVKDVSEEQAKRLRSRGYKPEVRNGNTLFCRKETALGSRFESKVCGTAADLDKATRNGKDLTESAQRNQLNPSGK